MMLHDYVSLHQSVSQELSLFHFTTLSQMLAAPAGAIVTVQTKATE